MRLYVKIFAAVAVLFTLPGLSSFAAEGVGVGDTAPAFELPGSDGKTYALSDFAGERAVVVAWFPKAFTGG